METKVNFELNKNRNLLKAFENRCKKRFEYWLENGAHPEEVDPETKASPFEILCEHPESSVYVQKCLDYKTDPNTENHYTKLYPIHLAVQNLCVKNIEILLKADHYCANQIVDSDKTPLHYLAEKINDDNLRTVFVIIKLFSEYGAVFSWPARKSGNKTPFLMFLERMEPLLNKATCVKIIRFLIQSHPRIDKFQRTECAKFIKSTFPELATEYQSIKNWKEEAEDEMDWKTELKKLMLENEAQFLVKFDIQKSTNEQELKELLSEGTILIESIELNRFESFVAIISLCGLNFDKINQKELIEKVLERRLYKFMKYIYDHENIKKVRNKWMIEIISQMEDKDSDIDPNVRKAFHITLNHPKYHEQLNEPIPKMENARAITFAAIQSNYAMVEMLKKGAILDDNNNGLETIKFIDSVALKKYFDSCVTKCISDNLKNKDYYMVIDYSFLQADKEMSTIDFIAESRDLQPLICHPVVASFLFLKWLRLTNIFYLNLLLISINAISFSAYLSIYYVNQEDHLTDRSDTSDIWLQVLQMLSYWSFIMFSSKELIQIIGSPKVYLTTVVNLFEIAIMCLMVLVLFIPLENQEARRTIAAFLFLGFAIEWTLIVSTLPLFAGSNYLAMLKRVAVNFLRTLTFYSIILMAFAVSFHTLVNNTEDIKANFTIGGSNATKKENQSEGLETVDDPNKSSMFSVFFQIVLMLTGDFGSITEKSEHYMVGRIFLLIFVLSMTIVLMNLLIGLTVSDTAAIEKETEWHKWWERTKLLAEYEFMVLTCLNWINNKKIKNMVCSIMHLMPDYLPMNKIKIEISSNASNEWIFVPRNEVPDDTGSDGKPIETDIVGDPFPLMNSKKKALSRTYFGCWKDPVKMDKRIVESGLKVLSSNQEIKSRKEMRDKKKAHREETKHSLHCMKQQQRIILEQINKK